MRKNIQLLTSQRDDFQKRLNDALIEIARQEKRIAALEDQLGPGGDGTAPEHAWVGIVVQTAA